MPAALPAAGAFASRRSQSEPALQRRGAWRPACAGHAWRVGLPLSRWARFIAGTHTMALTHEDNFLFTSESVNEGHPDKLCDQVRA